MLAFGDAVQGVTLTAATFIVTFVNNSASNEKETRNKQKSVKNTEHFALYKYDSYSRNSFERQYILVQESRAAPGHLI